MIVSIGIDIIEVARIREVLLRTPRFAERVFTRAEREYCDARGAVAAQHYAARFAAKEGAESIANWLAWGISWQDVEVATRKRRALPNLQWKCADAFRVPRDSNSSIDLTHERVRDRAGHIGTLINADR